MMSDKIFNILMAGVGGQGIILSSNILSAAAMNDGFDVKKSEIHGMSQRGGSVFSHIRFGRKVHSPVIPLASADILLSLELMESLRWIQYASSETNMIYINDKILPAGLKEYPIGIEDEIRRAFKNSYSIEPAEIKNKIQNPKTVNVALLGVLCGFLPLSQNAWKKAIEDFVPAGTAEINLSAFEAGKTLINKG